MTTVRAAFRTSPDKLELFVNGQLAATAPLKAALDREPNDTLQIGADLGSQVLKVPLPKFKGLIESVRIVSGTEPASPQGR